MKNIVCKVLIILCFFASCIDAMQPLGRKKAQIATAPQIAFEKKMVTFETRDDQTVTLPEDQAHLFKDMDEALERKKLPMPRVRYIWEEEEESIKQEVEKEEQEEEEQYKKKLPRLMFTKAELDPLIQELNVIIADIYPDRSLSDVYKLSAAERNRAAEKFAAKRSQIGGTATLLEVSHYLNTADNIGSPELIERYAAIIATKLQGRITELNGINHPDFDAVFALRPELLNTIAHYVPTLWVTTRIKGCGRVRGGHFFSEDKIVSTGDAGGPVAVTRVFADAAPIYPFHEDFQNPELYPVHSMSFSRNGKMLLVATRNTIGIYASVPGRILQEIKGNDIIAAGFSADGSKIVIVSPHAVRLVYLDRGTDFKTFETEREITKAVLSPDMKKIAIAFLEEHNLAKIEVIDMDTKKKLLDASSLGLSMSLESYPDTPLFSPDSSKIVLPRGRQGGALLYDLNQAAIVEDLPCGQSMVNQTVFSADGKRIICTIVHEDVYIYDEQTGNNIGRIMIHGQYPEAAAFISDRCVIVIAHNARRMSHNIKACEVVADTLNKKLFLDLLEYPHYEGNSLLTNDWILDTWETFSKDDRATISSMKPERIKHLVLEGKSAGLYKKLKQRYEANQ